MAGHHGRARGFRKWSDFISDQVRVEMLMCSTDEQAATEVSDLSPAEGATGFEARSIWLQIWLVFFKEVPDPTGLAL